MNLHIKYDSLLKQYNINTNLRLAHFFSQIHHESNFKLVSENLNYSRKRLLEVFPKYFNSKNVDEYANNPEKIANKVYSNRMGNGPEESGDGFKYIGRGFLQLTGYNNYKALSDFTGICYVNEPDLLLNEADSMISACWFWSVNNLNRYADMGDIKGSTRIINGGYTHLTRREELYKKYLDIFLK